MPNTDGKVSSSTRLQIDSKKKTIGKEGRLGRPCKHYQNQLKEAWHAEQEQESCNKDSKGEKLNFLAEDAQHQPVGPASPGAVTPRRKNDLKVPETVWCNG
eukprot:1157161-Pelagomonas_calceolata.AAC.19